MPLLIRSECDHDIIPDELSCQLGPDAGGFVVVGVEKSACENHGRGATPVGLWPSTHKYARVGGKNQEAGLAQLGERQTEVKLREIYLKVMCSIHINRTFFSFAEMASAVLFCFAVLSFGVED